ncbi:hypothetical protein WJX72_001046 [[Myrmecia] bisecta]|uniref:Uncharacterized protein n=1 Tax=[Myrmecia] bisecta TaxID=41462 RepID=A0AAW1R4G6_9CHLO
MRQASLSKSASETRRVREQAKTQTTAQHSSQRPVFVVPASHAPRQIRLRNTRRPVSLAKKAPAPAAGNAQAVNSKQEPGEQQRALSPTSPLHFSKATGRPASGPWIGAFGSPAHVLDSTPALYVDNIGHTHFGLDELNAAAAAASGSHPNRKANGEASLSLTSAEVPGARHEARRGHSREMAALLRKPISKYTAAAPRCSAQDMRRTRAISQPRQGF